MRHPVPVAVAALLLTAAPAAAEGGGAVGPAASPAPTLPQPSGTAPRAPSRPEASPRDGSPRPETSVDAGLLADLDLLDSADYRRDREAARRRGLLERLPLLEAERALPRPGDPTGAAGSPGKGAATGGAGETRR